MKNTVRTNVGVVRSENQDRAAVFENDIATFAILGDGMGGHTGGSHASTITLSTFEREFNKNFPSKIDKVEKWFNNTIKKAKKDMSDFAKDDAALMDMGTTITAAVIYDDVIKVFNIGDSRTYIYNGLLHQITQDHNLRNYYINNYGYSEEKAATVMGAAALTSALGPKKKSNINVYSVERNENVKFIALTSDGIHDYISKPVFEKIIGSNDSLEEKGDNLIAKAINGKSSDNLTVAIVEVSNA